MAILVNGQWSIATPSTDIGSNQATSSACITFSVNQPITTFIAFFSRNTASAGILAEVFGTNTLKAQEVGSAGGGSAVDNTATIAPNTFYQLAYIWKNGNQYIYLNGLLIASGTFAVNTFTSSSPYFIGASAAQTGLEITISQVAVFDGYDLTNTVGTVGGIADYINLLNGAATPLTTATAATWYPDLNNPGFANLGSSGAGTGNKYILSTITSSGGGTFSYVSDLVYVPPVALVGYVTEHGGFTLGAISTATGLATDITSIAANPTVFVDGISQSMYGPVWCNSSHEMPLAFYQFPSPISATNVVTYSVPFGAIVTLAGLSDTVANAPAANYFGILENPFGGASSFVPTRKMPLGVNIGGLQTINYATWTLARNARYRFSANFALTYDSDLQPLTVPINQAFHALYFNTATSNGIDALQAGYPTPVGVHSLVFEDVNAGAPGTYFTAPGGNALQCWLVNNNNTTTALGIDTASSGPGGGVGNVPLSGTATVTHGSPNVTLSTASRNQQGMTWTFSGGGSSGTYKVLSGSGVNWVLSTNYTGTGTSSATVTTSGSTYVRTVVGTTVTVSYWVDYSALPNFASGYNLGLNWFFKSPLGYWGANDPTSGTPTITNFWAFAPGDALTTVYANYVGPYPNASGNDRSDPYALSATFHEWLTAANGNGPACLRLMEPIMYSGAAMNFQTYSDCVQPTQWMLGGGNVQTLQVDYIRFYNTNPAKGPAGDNTYGWVSTKVYHPYLGFDGNDNGSGNVIGNYVEAGNYIDLTARNATGLTDNGNYATSSTISGAILEFVTHTPHGFRTGDNVDFPAAGAQSLPTPYWIAVTSGGVPTPVLIGTVSVFLGSSTIIFASNQTIAAGTTLTFDSTGAAYRITASGTSQTIYSIFPVFQGTTNATASAFTTAAIGLFNGSGNIVVTGPTTFVISSENILNQTNTFNTVAATVEISMSNSGALSGTASVNHNASLVTTTSSQSNQLGATWTFSGDTSNGTYVVTACNLAGTISVTQTSPSVTTSVSQSSNQVGMTWTILGVPYVVQSGSGTSWTLASNYAATTNGAATATTSLGESTSWSISPVFGGSNVTASTITSSTTFYMSDFSKASGTIIPYGLGAHMAAQFPGCACWIPLNGYASDACLQAIADEMAPFLLPNSSVVAERGLEHWNWPSFPGGWYDLFYGNLLAYVAAGTVVNDYYTAPGTPGNNSAALGGGNPVALRDQAYALMTAHHHDVLQAQFDTHNKGIKVVRLFGGQWSNTTFTSNMVTFAKSGSVTKSIPIGAIAVAPYMQPPSSTTYTAACSSTGGNWPCSLIHDFYRHYLKYSTSLIFDCTSQLAVINGNYTPDVTPYAGQTNGRPSLYCYEAQIQQIDPLDHAPLQHDLFYSPAMADTINTFLQMLQDNGVSLANLYNLGGFWGGGAEQQLWSVMIYGQQAYGDGSANLYTTAQGGSPGDGKCYDAFNQSVELPQVLAWFAVANGSASGSFIEKPTRIQPNVSSPSQILTFVGSGTGWTSGSTVSITNSITGTTTVTAGTWTALSTTFATLAVTTDLGTGTFTVTIDGITSPSITVGAKRKGWFKGMSRLSRAS